jgi:hypothetical protein
MFSATSFLHNNRDIHIPYEEKTHGFDERPHYPTLSRDIKGKVYAGKRETERQ